MAGSAAGARGSAGQNQGYRHHPQLDRFRAHRRPRSAISTYLSAVRAESARRAYAFDPAKVGTGRTRARIPVTEGQIAFEWEHLLRKLSLRVPECHPLMRRHGGAVEPWERP